ncbi:fibronectin type III domain-containing protein [Krasilnikovia sp. M28-CT-15]|uniref:fibronectin type III domain-containing protein n=1 Tax=Krasilnikovia sp. M28-CT-15 TaxID=3373540 RepID=UPI003876917A
MPHRTTTPARILAGAATGLLAAALLPAVPAAADPVSWTACADETATECVAEAVLTPLGGVPAPLAQFGLTASAELTYGRLSWAVDGWAGQPANVVGGRLSLTVRTGSWRPGFTIATADDLAVTPGGDSDNWSLTVTGRPAHVDWVTGDITADPDEMADPAASGAHFSGTTNADDPYGYNAFGDGAYLTTTAQSRPFGMDYSAGGDAARFHLQGMLRNPHLDAGGRPVPGSFTLWLPGSWFTGRGTTAEDAVDTGFDLVDTARSLLSVPITAALRDGGVELHTDDLEYGTPSPYPFIYLRPSGADGHARPGAPTDVDATGAPGKITATWSAPDSNGGLPVTGYTVRAFTEPEGGSLAGTCRVVPVGDDGTSCTVNGLTANETYYLAVSAGNALGEGPSQDQRHEVTAATIARPSAPTAVRVTAGKGSLTASWHAPESDNGSPITAYTAYAYRGAASQNLVSSCTVAAPALSCVLRGLGNGVGYHVAVTATNKAGEGPANDARVAGTPRTTPGAPRQASVSTSRGRARVKWAAPASTGGAAVTGYRVRAYGTRSGASVAAQCTTTGAVRECVLTGLKVGRTYYVSVVALNAAGSSVEASRITILIRR